MRTLATALAALAVTVLSGPCAAAQQANDGPQMQPEPNTNCTQPESRTPHDNGDGTVEVVVHEGGRVWVDTFRLLRWRLYGPLFAHEARTNSMACHHDGGRTDPLF